MPALRILLLLSSTMVLSNLYAKTYLVNEGRNVQNKVSVDNPHGSRLNIESYIGSFEGEKSQFPNDFIEDVESLKFSNFEMTDDAGKASLPYYSFIVAQPKSNLSIQFKNLAPKLFKGLYAQVAATKPCRCDKTTPINYSVNGNYYNSQDGLYHLESLGAYRGKALTKVYIYGARQTQEGLEVYPSLKMAIESKDHSPVRLANLDFQAANKKFLVISAKALESAAQEFKSFKESVGFDVDLFIYEEEASDAEELRDFIRSKYQENQYQYAVIVGSENSVPTFYRETSMSWETPTDYPYFYMDETQDQADYFPEIFYGRLTGQSNDEVLVQIEKLREYVDETWEDDSGMKKTMGIASNEGVNPSDEDYVHSMLGPLESQLGMNSTYYFQKNSNSTVQNINDTLNNGLYWINYIGHGSGVSWPSINQDQYRSGDVASLIPGKVKPVIIDVACQNGRFNDEGRLGESFMTSSISGAPVGALSYFGGSVDVSWDPPAIMAVGIGESVGKQAGQSLFGHIMYGQSYLIRTYSDIEASKENLVWYHLLGDPSLEIKHF